MDKFLEELVALCRKHQLVITSSMYDNFQVWSLEDERDLRNILEAEDHVTRAIKPTP